MRSRALQPEKSPHLLQLETALTQQQRPQHSHKKLISKNVMRLNHPETIPHPWSVKKYCFPGHQSLVPKRLGIMAVTR